MGSKSKTKKDEIKSTTKYRNGTKESKKENALDIKSMSIKKALWIKSRTIEENYERKFGFIIGYSIGSKSNKNLMKSFQNNIPGSEVKKSKTGKRPGYNK